MIIDVMNGLEQLTHAQRERLAFLDFCLNYFGSISRAALMDRFGTGLAAATRDFAAYKSFAPDNLVLRHNNKVYERTLSFKPLFEHDPSAVLSCLANGFGNGISQPSLSSSRCIVAPQLILPKIEIISALMRSIHVEKPIQCTYVSLSSGITKRELVPHSLANDGRRWHVRAYDREKTAFRDFSCSRFENIAVIDDTPHEQESRESDYQWNRWVELELIPHPSLPLPRAIELDFGMENGLLLIKTRAALAGYLLSFWNVDCSERFELNSGRHSLALKNRLTLYGVENLVIAPGYEVSKTGVHVC